MRFICGHYWKGQAGPKNPTWKGGRYVSRGYVYVLRRDHPRAYSNGYVFEHVLVAERALGRPLPPKAVVHHVDGDGTNNDPSNLVICEDQSYHLLLHQRQRALDACGHADWFKCGYGGEYDDPGNMYVLPSGRSAWHRECKNRYERDRQDES